MTYIDVIIIGAGISGLGAAYELQKKGKKVLVLEKESYVGGRMSTKYIDGIPIDLGAQFITPSYKNLWTLINELKLNPVKIASGNLAIKRNNNLYGFNTANPISFLTYKGLSNNSKYKLIVTLIKKLFEARKTNLYDTNSYLKFDDIDIYQDLIQKAGQENLDYFFNPMCEALFLYDMKEFSKAIFLAALSKLMFIKLYSFPKGIGYINQKIANKVNVKLGVKVKSVNRLKGKIIIKTDKADYECSQVVIAITGDRVLNLIDNPYGYEEEFFSKIKYSKGGYAYLQGKTDYFQKYSTVWLPKKENPQFASIGLNQNIKNKTSSIYFDIEIREKANRLIQDKNKLKQSIKNLINVKRLQILHTHFWDSALPKFIPGHIKKIIEFARKSEGEKQIFYCGDYLENPSTEGALTSGLKAANKLLKQ